MATRYYPKNWAKMFGIDTSINQNTDNLFMTVEAFTTPSIRYFDLHSWGTESPYDFAACQPAKGPDGNPADTWKIWWPKESLKESVRHDYSENSSSFDTAMNDIKENVASVVKAPAHIMNKSTGSLVYDAPMVWSKTPRRDFSMVIHLLAYDDMDSDVYDLLKFFRNNSYSTRTGNKFNMVDYPSVFKITGGVWNIIQNPECPYYTLRMVDITYGEQVQFLKGGLPMSATLNLTFTESNVIFKDMFDKKRVNISVKGLTDGSNAAGEADEKAQRQTIRKIQRKFGSNNGDYPVNLGNGMVDGADTDPFNAQRETMFDMQKGIVRAKGFVPLASPVPEKKAQSASGTAPSPYAAVLKTIAKQLLVRAAQNAKNIIIAQVKSKITELIQKSKLYKKITSVTDIDPRHRVEVKSKMKKVKAAKWVL